MVSSIELGLVPSTSVTFNEWLENSWHDAGYSIELSAIRDGHLPNWLESLNRLPFLKDIETQVHDTVAIGDTTSVDAYELLSQSIRLLKPWRKGPFRLCGHFIDAEWRCDFKWRRFGDRLDWRNKTVLDVGCGNGYFGFQALNAGAISVLGVESFMLYVMQAALLNWYAQTPHVVVPLRFGEEAVNGLFDVVLSMGVIYHQRDSDSHLNALFRHCRPSGQVVLESIIADEDFVPEDRYAGMRNVYLIPSIKTLKNKLEQAGFKDPQLIDVSATANEEQQKTRYMPFHSLADALDPQDQTTTIEGYPAPKRAILMAFRT
ncbi:MAG: tRNA 5-methoxyuridine(34)/uridine 5-oxyacetic acid(34) synthase CmoB [Gammaproteobacteria bacterium]|nr:tRNA 5-methoxyuridine(34)/uridine 5-oxyacetic acid(34) synthase CmoB [Gammaproteobacteria bacterium]